MRAVIAIFLLVCFQPYFVLGDESLRGILTIYSSDSVISQPYPVEYETPTIEELASSSLQFDCTVCDPGAPTEHCFEEIGVCATLSNTTVSIIGTNGAQLNTLPLDPQCTPRYLQRLDMEIAVVVCHDSCFHVITRTGSTFELHPIACGTGRGGIVIRTRTRHWGHPSYILIELNGNQIFESDLSAAGPTINITPHTNCADYLSLIPLHTQENFMLLCNTTAGQRLYIVNRFNRDDVPSVELNNAPISSPDGRTFAAAAGSVLELYRSNNLAQYPGVKDFGADITLCTYLNSATLLVGLDGGGQILVLVETFIDSVGVDGLTTLPYTSSNSRVHKLISQDVYATTNYTGNLYNVLLYNITSGQALDPVSGLLEEPVNIFFRHGVAPDPSPMADLPHTSDQLPTLHSFPTTSYTISPALTSKQLIETSFPPVSPDVPKPSPSDRFLKKLGDISPYIWVALTLTFTITTIFIAMGFVIQYSKRQKSCHSGKLVCLLRQPVEETDEERGGSPADESSIGGGPPADKSFVGGDGSSARNETATQVFSSYAPNKDISSSGSSCRNSQNNFYTDPISETQM